MPTPAKTSTDEIVAAGRGLLEREGLDALTLKAVAEIVGVRAPSLYKRIGGRGDLVRRIVNVVSDELAAQLAAAPASADARDSLRGMVLAARAFALAHPHAYGLLFAPLPEDWGIDPDVNARISGIVIGAAGRVAGEDDALTAARLVVAWIHGFVTMELAGAFRLGGDVDGSFDYGIDALLRGIAQPG
jgi:AcrR family transcriptional regulator